MARACGRCGSRLPPEVHFCPNCGSFYSPINRFRRTLRIGPGVDPSEKRLGVERTKAGLALMALTLALYSVPILGYMAILPGALAMGFLISGSRPFRGNHSLLVIVAALAWTVGIVRLLVGWQSLVQNTRFVLGPVETHYREFFDAALLSIVLQVMATALIFAGLQDGRGLVMVVSAAAFHGALASLFLYATWLSILQDGGASRLWDYGFRNLQEEVFFLVSMSTVGNIAWVPISLRTHRRLVEGRIPLRRSEIDLRIE